MIECVLIGDSLAVGIAQHLPKCLRYAKVGIAAENIFKIIPQQITADDVAISLGSNNPTNPKLREELIKVRNSIKAKRVFWVLPNHPIAKRTVVSVAESYRDNMIDSSPWISKDGVHPTGKGYEQMSKFRGSK